MNGRERMAEGGQEVEPGYKGEVLGGGGDENGTGRRETRAREEMLAGPGGERVVRGGRSEGGGVVRGRRIEGGAGQE